MFGAACGIRPLKPGFAQALIAPQPDRRVASLSAVLDTVHGRIRSAWSRTDDGFRYEIETPTDAKIVIDGRTYAVGKGKYLL